MLNSLTFIRALGLGSAALLVYPEVSIFDAGAQLAQTADCEVLRDLVLVGTGLLIRGKVPEFIRNGEKDG